MSRTVYVQLVVEFTEGKDGQRVPRVAFVEVPPGTDASGEGRTRIPAGEVVEVHANEMIRALITRGELQVVKPEEAGPRIAEQHRVRERKARGEPETREHHEPNGPPPVPAPPVNPGPPVVVDDRGRTAPLKPFATDKE